MDKERGIDTGKQTLGGSLFVAGGAVDLACQEQTLDLLGLHRDRELARIVEVVLDSVTRTRNHGIFKA